MASEAQRLAATLSRAPELVVGKAVFRLDVGELAPPYAERARVELREEPRTVAEGLAELRRLLAAEPELRAPADDDAFLRKFLRPCKWHPDSAFELLRRFYKFRAAHPRFCEHLWPSNERALLLSGAVAPLPRRTASGCRVVLVEGGKRWRPKDVSLDQIFRGTLLFLEAAVSEPTTQVAGVRVILDMEGLSLGQVAHFTPAFAAAVVDFVQNCLPCRLKGVHVVNQPYLFNLVFALFKPFLRDKLRRRLHFHGADRASLLRHFDAPSLPTRFGGELELPDEPLGEPFVQYLLNFEDEFKESSKYGYPSRSKS